MLLRHVSPSRSRTFNRAFHRDMSQNYIDATICCSFCFYCLLLRRKCFGSIYLYYILKSILGDQWKCTPSVPDCTYINKDAINTKKKMSHDFTAVGQYINNNTVWWQGALTGALSAIVLVFWMSIGAQVAAAKGNVYFETKVTSVENCLCNVTEPPYREPMSVYRFLLPSCILSEHRVRKSL